MTPTVLKWRKNEPGALAHFQLEGIFLREISGRRKTRNCCFTTCRWHFRRPKLDHSLRGGRARNGRGRSPPLAPKFAVGGARRTSRRSLDETGWLGDILVFPNRVPALTSLLPGVPTRRAGLAPPPNSGPQVFRPALLPGPPLATQPPGSTAAAHKEAYATRAPGSRGTATDLELQAGRQSPRASPP